MPINDFVGVFVVVYYEVLFYDVYEYFYQYSLYGGSHREAVCLCVYLVVVCEVILFCNYFGECDDLMYVCFGRVVSSE